jgi:glycosyltransferase involved in cell wall biosynthesis
MENKPLVSVITATYNSEKFIEKTINSILSQTYKNFELIITDDCSEDNTLKIVEKFAAKDSRIRYFKLESNQGPGIARNNSIYNSSGKFIAFCDSDDQWKPPKLQKQINFMIKNQVVFSFSSYEIINENSKYIGKVIAKKTVNYNDMLKNNYIHCLTAIYDKDYFGKVYMPSIRKRQDWALWLKLLKKVEKGYSIQEPLAIYRKRNFSTSSKKIELLKYNWAIYNKIEKFSFFHSIFLLIRFLYYYILKKKNHQ